MRIAILNADYEPFLRSLYRGTPGLENASYQEQLDVRNQSLFGVADFYSRHLRELGHDAQDLHVNNAPMQSAWAREHGLNVSSASAIRWHTARAVESMRTAYGIKSRARAAARYARRRVRAQDGLHLVLQGQIEEFRPDIVWNQAMDWVSSRLLRTLRPRVGLIVGQVAAPLPPRLDLRPYDVVLSSLSNFVEYFRSRGIPAHDQPLGFDSKVLDAVPPAARDLPLTFVGSISEAHQSRIELIELLCEQTPIQIWGTLSPRLAASSPIHRCYRGEAWGREMYSILRRSQLTLNTHIDVAAGYANNMRLFEATGVATPLLTDARRNLSDLFEVGREVATYADPEECLAEVDRLLADPATCRMIGERGQERTLRDHTYRQRAADFLDIVGLYL